MGYEDIAESVISGDIDGIQAQVDRYLADGATANEIIEQGLLGGMAVVGKRFKEGDMFIPEVMRSARAMNDVMVMLEPLMMGQAVASAGKMVIGTVAGDLHNIGKDLLSMVLRSSGFQVIDLGVGVTAEAFLEAVLREKPDVLGLSALLTTTMPAMQQAVKLIRSDPAAASVKIIIGGAPVNAAFADEIGADAYAPDAGSALETMQELVSV